MRDLFTRTLTVTTLAASLWTAHLSAQAVERDPDQENKIEYQLIFPDEKTPESVKPNEPNPFNKEAHADEDESSSEENSVRDVLMSLPISGLSTDPQGGKRLMLGPMRLERGMMVPDVLSPQGVHLRVNSISDTALELVWVEKKNTGLPPRALIIPFNVRPTVKKLLPAVAAKLPVPSNGTSRFGTYDPNRQTPGYPQQGNQPSSSSTASSTPSSVTPPPPAPAPNDPNHPANMLMNLLLNKSQPTQQPQKAEQAKE